MFPDPLLITRKIIHWFLIFIVVRFLELAKNFLAPMAILPFDIIYVPNAKLVLTL